MTERAKVCDLVESTIRGMVAGVDNPRFVMTGIHNAFAHGDCLTQKGLEVPDKALEKLFQGLDLCLEALDVIAVASGLE